VTCAPKIWPVLWFRNNAVGISNCRPIASNGKTIMNFKGYGMKRSWADVKYILPCPVGTEEKKEHPQSGYLVSRPKFELITSRIQVASVAV
jgi:hypothetical protein